VSAPPPPVDRPAGASPAVARLEARVAALEAALERRSRERRRIQAALPPRDLVALSRILAGLPPRPVSPYDPERWRETTELTPADVEETLTDLWGSLSGGGERPR
jgi:hypothetical protein